MNYEQILLSILALNFVTYIGIVWAKFGILPSMSDSFYEWKEWKEGTQWLFTLFCWIITFTLLPLEPNPFFFFAAAGAGFVGAAPQIKKEFVKKVHVKAAIILLTSGLLGIGFTFNDWWLVVGALSIGGLIKLFKVNNSIWWIEMTAYITILYGLYKNIF